MERFRAAATSCCVNSSATSTAAWHTSGSSRKRRPSLIHLRSSHRTCQLVCVLPSKAISASTLLASSEVRPIHPVVWSSVQSPEPIYVCVREFRPRCCCFLFKRPQQVHPRPSPGRLSLVA